MLYVHRAERADRLAGALGELLAEPSPDPFAREVVAVTTRGVERWLSQTLAARLGATSGRDGVCANVAFPFPGRVIASAVAVASGIEPDTDPWLLERTVWPLLETVEACTGEPWLAALSEHLESAPGRRFARVRVIAGLFDGYQVRRPALIDAWARGGGDERSWQPRLWRALRARIGMPSPAERLAGACTRLRDHPDLLDLPARLSLFGLTRMAPSHLGVLDALAAGRDVHLMLLHPSPALWERVSGPVACRHIYVPADGPAIVRALDPTVALPRNRLLASWGRESRELQLVLGGRGVDLHHPLDVPVRSSPTLLTTLQADIRADRQPPGSPLPGAPEERLVLTPADESVRIHACHGRHRQVEVLRQAILHRLAADPTLEPRDVIVMCPDVETFAPLIQATFGTTHAADSAPVDEQDEWSGTDLRVRLADRALRQTNPVLGVIAQLLELASARLTASQVLDLADTEPVRRRFQFGDDDLARIQEWIVAAGIHWGLDAPSRGPFGLADLEAGTWVAGLRRLLLGVALGEDADRLYAGVLPLEDVEGDAIELAGRLAELLGRLGEALDSLARPQTIGGWAQALARAADALTAVADADAWQRYELSRLLDDVVAEAAGAGAAANLALPEVRALLADRLEGRPTRANFRTGHLTVCTLHPMRSVPHRVVCLLGLDDGAFPRRTPRNGDDLLLEQPHVGDRDPRAEDRQLLLDALLAAGEHLIVTYTGNDERTNAPRPPAVPVGELLDAIDATARSPTPGTADPSARGQVLIRHPLQPFDPANFVAGRLATGRPWSFDPVALEGARALVGARRPAEPFLREPLPPLEEETVALTDLVAFVERPVRAFVRQRLGISVVDYDDEVRDELPVELDGLELWGVGQRLLEGVLSGRNPVDIVQAEIARGTLPPGELGRPVLMAVRDKVVPIVRSAGVTAGAAPPVSVQTNVLLRDGTRLTGTVAGVRDRVLLSATYSRLGPRHRISAWVRLLALTAAQPEVPYEAITIGRRDDDPDDPAVVRIPPLGRGRDERLETALAELATVLDLRRRGMREPLPLPCLAAAAYASARHGGMDRAIAVERAGGEWTSRYPREKEDRAREHVLAFGRELALSELLAIPPSADEAGGDWAVDEPSRFGRLAWQLWAPLLRRESFARP